MYEYGSDFYAYNVSFAMQSAQRIVPLLCAAMPVRSVADFGCGQGVWLAAWRRAGATVIGVDGPYVDPRGLLIDADSFRPADLTEAIDLGGRFDLVQSLEVAEHIPAAHAGGFIDNLVAHGPVVLFSAAVPGQGGEHHVNEQPLGYWRAKFHERGYAAIDYLRPLIVDDPAIQSWYRYNSLLYVKEEHVAALPQSLRSRRVADGDELIDYRPLADRLRNAVVRRLPVGAVDQLSRARASLAAWRR